jgi:8-oxo-dGTP diphosphatase
MAEPPNMQSFNWSTWEPKEAATLCFVRQGARVLMIRKKRGLGAGKINGVGGRLEPGETPEIGIVREAQEELEITLLDPARRGELHFQFIDGYSLFCTVFVATRYDGAPVSTAEADPIWYEVDRLPLSEMWEDDKLWLGGALAGDYFHGYFVFDGETMLSHKVDWEPGKTDPNVAE